MTDELFKPGYEGARPSSRLSGTEKQAFLQAKAQLVNRLHEAMLTLSVVGSKAELGIGSGSPQHIVEFSDRVGEEQPEPERVRFMPTAAQVSDMDRALALLEGLRPKFFKVVFFRSIDEFQRDNGERGDWPWAKIGGYFGLSARWAEGAYDAAIVQAARRAGVLPIVSQDHAILACAVWLEDGYLTSLTTSADPRQETSNLRSKSPVRIESAFAIWTTGKPLAKRILDAAKPEIANLQDHASWYKANPDVLAEILVSKAREIGAPWHFEDFKPEGLRAA